MGGKRLERHHKEAILNDLRKRQGTYQQLSRKHSVSVSTIHRIAEQEGLTNRRQRTSAVERPEHTYDKEKRVGVLDRILKSVEDTVSKGGLSSKQLLDISRAAKEVSAARQNEDRIDPESIAAQKPDEKGYVSAGLGDIKIHKDDPLFEDFLKLEQGVAVPTIKANREREGLGGDPEYNGEGLA